MLCDTGCAGARVLVLGCGTSSLPLDLAADGFAVTATDIAPAAVERMRARATALVGPAKACRPTVCADEYEEAWL